VGATAYETSYGLHLENIASKVVERDNARMEIYPSTDLELDYLNKDLIVKNLIRTKNTMFNTGIKFEDQNSVC